MTSGDSFRKYEFIFMWSGFQNIFDDMNKVFIRKKLLFVIKYMGEYFLNF